MRVSLLTVQAEECKQCQRIDRVESAHCLCVQRQHLTPRQQVRRPWILKDQAAPDAC